MRDTDDSDDETESYNESTESADKSDAESDAESERGESDVESKGGESEEEWGGIVEDKRPRRSVRGSAARNDESDSEAAGGDSSGLDLNPEDYNDIADFISTRGLFDGSDVSEHTRIRNVDNLPESLHRAHLLLRHQSKKDRTNNDQHPGSRTS